MIKKLFYYGKENNRITILSIIFLFLAALLLVLPFLFIYQTIYALISKQEITVVFILREGIAILICLIIQAALYVKGLSLSHKAAYGTIMNIRVSLQNKMEKLPLGLIPVMLMYKIGNKGMSDYYTAGQIMNNTIIEYVNGMEEIIMKDKKNALNGKDYINIGIFTAIYMVIVIAIACTVGLIPIGFILLPVIIPVIGGIPMMMYFTKIKKFGMILIFEILFGIVMILTGMGCDLLLWGIVVGIIGELILRAARYSSGKMAVFCYGVLSTCICGNYIH